MHVIGHGGTYAGVTQPISAILRACLIAAAAAATLSGCATKKDGPQPVVSIEPPTKSDAWRPVATEADESRLDRIGIAWATALAEAGRRNRGEVAVEGDLLQPRAALARPEPTPGSYNCRLVRLGRTTNKVPAFEKFQPFFCYVEVEGDLLTIVKQTGSERPAGRLWADDRGDRLIFLGTIARDAEKEPLAYGDNSKRDVAGVFERFAPFKWRLVIPWPQGTSKLDVYELSPVADQPEG